MRTRGRRRGRERGALLGIVLILLVVILASSIFAFYSVKSDTGAAGNDRLMRQLLDCAEEGLAQGKQYYSQPTQRSQWSSYFESDVHTLLPIAQPTNSTATPVGYPLQVTLTIGGAPAPVASLHYWVGIYNNPGDPGNAQNPIVDTDNRIMVVSRCAEVTDNSNPASPVTNRSRTVQALLTVPAQQTGDYFGQAGGGFRGQGNTNNNF